MPDGSRGHYRLSVVVPLVATQAANGTLFSFRWTSSTLVAVIKKLRISVLQTAAATATIFPNYEVFVARSFSAADSAGTALTLSGNSMKVRTSMAGTALSAARISAAAAGLTVGTRTLDPHPQLVLTTASTITTPNLTLYENETDPSIQGGSVPIVLATNEGIIVRGPTTVFGAADAANLNVHMMWMETSSYTE